MLLLITSSYLFKNKLLNKLELALGLGFKKVLGIKLDSPIFIEIEELDLIFSLAFKSKSLRLGFKCYFSLYKERVLYKIISIRFIFNITYKL